MRAHFVFTVIHFSESHRYEHHRQRNTRARDTHTFMPKIRKHHRTAPPYSWGRGGGWWGWLEGWCVGRARRTGVRKWCRHETRLNWFGFLALCVFGCRCDYVYVCERGSLSVSGSVAQSMNEGVHSRWKCATRVVSRNRLKVCGRDAPNRRPSLCRRYRRVDVDVVVVVCCRSVYYPIHWCYLRGLDVATQTRRDALWLTEPLFVTYSERFQNERERGLLAVLAALAPRERNIKRMRIILEVNVKQEIYYRGEIGMSKIRIEKSSLKVQIVMRAERMGMYTIYLND